MAGEIPPFAMFKPGTYRSMEGVDITMSDYALRRTAEVYNERQDRAPIVINHPRDDRPIYGTISRASFSDGYLWAHPADVAPSLRDGVRSGRYEGVSVQFMPPEHPLNPTPGTYHIKHVGILDKLRPAVKGMPAVSFADSRVGEMEMALSFSAPVVEPMLVRARRMQADYPGMSYADACDIIQLEEQACELSFGEGDDEARRRVQWERVRGHIERTKARFRTR
jgi:hypothetical protein